MAVPESLFDPQVNGEVLGTVTSQFIRYSFDLPSLKGLNRLEVGAWTNGDDIQIVKGRMLMLILVYFMSIHYVRLYALIIFDLNSFCF